MKRGKRINTKADTQRIRRVDFRSNSPDAVVEYDEDESKSERYKPKKVHKAVYISALALILVVIGLAVYMNWGKFTFETFGSWFKVQLMGTGQGDGYPVDIKGNNVYKENFAHTDGNAVILSDTAFTVLNSTGKEVFSVRHSFDTPAVTATDGNYLLYNSGGTGYMVQIGSDTTVSGTSDYPISAGAVGSDGTYALGVQSKEFASSFEAYKKTGVKKYWYSFADRYITAVSINPSNTMAVVCTIGSEKGELNSTITVLDFNDASKPVSEYTTRDNMIMDVVWTGSERIMTVGDKSAVICNVSSYSYHEYSYGGKRLTAYELSQNNAIISISSYEYSGSCSVMVIGGTGEPIQVESRTRVTSISAYAGVFALLVGDNIDFYDLTTGEKRDSIDAGKDVKGIALGSESMAYLLGITQIRTVYAGQQALVQQP